MRQEWFIVICFVLRMVSFSWATGCASNPCLNWSYCAEHATGSYTCYCVPPFHGTRCELMFNGCDTFECQNGGTCHPYNENNVPYCVCASGYTGTNCETETTPCDFNECTNNATCSNNGNNYTCNCTPEYTGFNCQYEKNLVTDYTSVEQSSSYGSSDSSPRAVDGNFNSDYHQGSCSLTSDNDHPTYWQVTLAQAYKVKRIKITTRQDCCTGSLRDIDIYIGDALCNHFAGPASTETITIMCSTTLTGNTVKIQGGSNMYLSLCEVEAYIA